MKLALPALLLAGLLVAGCSKPKPAPATPKPAESIAAPATPAPKPKPFYSEFVPEGYTLTFHDEFNAKEIDAKVWHLRDDKFGAAKLDKTFISLDGKGNLLLQGDRDEDGTIRAARCSTSRSFRQAGGYFEARIRHHKSQGFHGAFWVQASTIGKTLDAEVDGVELDIIEYFGDGRWDSGLSHNLHWGRYHTAHHMRLNQKIKVENPSTEFHIYSLEWTATEYIFCVDGKVTWRVPAKDCPISRTPQYVIFSLLCSDWEKDRIVPALLPSALAVDYIRVYANPATAPKPLSKPKPKPQPAT